MQRWTVHPLPWHRTFIQRRKRFNIIRYGRRSGKTSLLADLGLESAAHAHNLAIALPTAKDFEKRWVEFERYYYRRLREARVSDQVMIFTTGARMDWFGMHRTEGMRGNKYRRFLFDECDFAPDLKGTWEMVARPTLVDYKGDAYFASTPNGRKHLWELEQQAKESDDWYVQHGTAYDNPYIDHGEREEPTRTMWSPAFTQEIMGEYLESSGALIKRDWVRKGSPPADAKLRVFLGVDLAISQSDAADYTALVVAGIDADNHIWVLDAKRGRWTFHEQKREIIAMADRHNVDSVAVEKVQYQAVMMHEFRRESNLVVRSISPRGDKMFRAQPLAGKYEHGYVHHSPHLPNDFEKEITEFTGTKDDDHDDYVDALVYAAGISQKTLVYEI